MRVRKAVESDLLDIYMMGYDVWAKGAQEQDYLEQCSLSPKYKRGCWWVLEDDSEVVSSLIIYTFPDKCFGIGSLATSLERRKNGYATNLLKYMVDNLKTDANGVFLYSDLDTSFYEKHGFEEIPEELQLYKESRCMYLRELGPHTFREDIPLVIQEYF